MRWILMRVFAVQIFCLLAVGAARSIGVHKPVPLNVALLHLDECQLPCWIGITPHKTPFTDAIAHIHAIYGLEPKTNTIGDVKTATYELSGQIAGQKIVITLIGYYDSVVDNAVQDVRIEFQRQNMPMLGEILNHQSPPKFIYSDTNWVVSYFDWFMEGVSAGSGCQNYQYFGVYDFVYAIILGSNPIGAEGWYEWRGFRSCYH